MTNPNNTSVIPMATRTDPEHLIVLMEKLDPFLQYRPVAINTRYTINASQKPICYFIRSGAVSMYRQPGDILIELFDAPTLRGAIPMPEGSQSVYTLKAIVPSEIATISREQLFELLSEHQLWELFARHQLAINGIGIEKIFKLTAPTAYNIVRHQLYELINMPEAVRENILAETYIRSKTRISRSGIMRILSDLKDGGYIVIAKGILKEVHHLPENY